MSGAQLIVVATILGTLIAVVTLVLGVKDRAEKQADADRKRISDAFKAGADSRADEVRLLTSQRDDARHDRDVAQAQADEGWRRYNDLRDRGQN